MPYTPESETGLGDGLRCWLAFGTDIYAGAETGCPVATEGVGRSGERVIVGQRRIHLSMFWRVLAMCSSMAWAAASGSPASIPSTMAA